MNEQNKQIKKLDEVEKEALETKEREKVMMEAVANYDISRTLLDGKYTVRVIKQQDDYTKKTRTFMKMKVHDQWDKTINASRHDLDIFGIVGLTEFEATIEVREKKGENIGNWFGIFIKLPKGKELIKLFDKEDYTKLELLDLVKRKS